MTDCILLAAVLAAVLYELWELRHADDVGDVGEPDDTAVA